MYRLGIIGTGRIAQRMVDTGLNGMDIRCTCVYNPKLDSARCFSEKNGIDVYTDDYDTLAASTDIIYVASPHETHSAYCRELISRGKHILCEKPLALNKMEAKELFGLADKKNLVLKEAVKTAFCPGFEMLLDKIAEGKIGRVVDVEATFTRLTPENVREYTKPVYNGSMLEFGSYGFLPVMRILGTDYTDVDFNCIYNAGGVDIYSKAFFKYDGAMATVKAGLGAKSEGQLIVSGTKGYIVAAAPWWMTKKIQIRYEDPSVVEEYSAPYEGSGLQYEIKYMLEACEAKRNHAAVTHKLGVTEAESTAMADIMERFLENRKSR